MSENATCKHTSHQPRTACLAIWQFLFCFVNRKVIRDRLVIWALEVRRPILGGLLAAVLGFIFHMLALFSLLRP